MTKPWNTPEWKEKRTKLIDSKSCEWCGSKDTLCLHHKNKEQPYLVRYKKATQALLGKLIRDGVYEPTNKCACPECGSFSIRKFRATRYRCLDCSEYFSEPKWFKRPLRVSKEDFADFVEKNTQIIKESLEKEHKIQFEKYMSFEETMILCKKCHKAITEAMVLCQICKKAYHKQNRDRCWSCFSETEKGREILKAKELVDFVHPWCRRVFKVERRSLEAEHDNPGLSCYPHCGSESFSCESAQARRK